jgi:hypothetical protein
MQKYLVIKAYRIFALVCLCGLLSGIARAETLHLTDNQTVTGDVVSMDGSGIILKQPDGSYGDRIPWGKISQADLKELEQNPRAAQYVEPFIEPSPVEKTKKTDIPIKDFHRLDRPAGHSLIGAMFTTPMGLFLVLMLYGANLYAAYEVSAFRGQPVGLVCGVSAVAPVVGPIIFLSIQPKLKHKPADWNVAAQHLDESIAAVAAAEQAVPAEIGAAEVAAEATAAHAAPAQPAAPQLPPTKTYARGQYTFNRRFFETQVPAFFAMTRPEAEKDKVLQVKSARGTHIAQRICRISATDLSLQVEKGPASEEVTIPFVEIQEVLLKHKDA